VSEVISAIGRVSFVSRYLMQVVLFNGHFLLSQTIIMVSAKLVGNIA